jgi:hypothetical protein
LPGPVCDCVERPVSGVPTGLAGAVLNSRCYRFGAGQTQLICFSEFTIPNAAHHQDKFIGHNERVPSASWLSYSIHSSIEHQFSIICNRDKIQELK